MKTRIIVNVFYKPSSSLQRFVETCGPLYVHVNGGSKLCQPGSWAEKWLVRDDTGDSISNMNSELNELTSIYWAWKNYDWTGTDFIGFNHYRRFFDPLILARAGKWDLLVARPIKLCLTIRQQYAKCHSREHLRQFAEIVEQKFPRSGLKDFLKSKQFFAPCNMLVARKDLFFEWCEFVFPLVFQLQKQLKLSKNPYQHRALAFLSERLTSFWAWTKFRGGKTEIEQAEIKFLKNALKGRK